MSSRRTHDYEHIFDALPQLSPGVLSVSGLVVDYEAATWQALWLTTSHVKIKCRPFHFSQALYRKVQELGLQVVYNTNAGTFAQQGTMADRPKHDPPHGMEPYDLGGPGDLGALSDEQQQKLNAFKIKTRAEDELYLRKHPEVNCLLTGFMNEILIERPNEVREFAAGYFTQTDLPEKVKQQLEERTQEQRLNKTIQKL